MENRVVVTGMGVVSPLGNDVAEYWRGLCQGRSGVRALELDLSDEYPSRIAGIAPEAIPSRMNGRDLNRRDRYVLIGIYAAEKAWAQSGLDLNKENPFRCGSTVGTGIGGLGTIEEQVSKFAFHGPKRVSPLMVPKVLTNMAAGEVAMYLGLMGPCKAVVTACAAGTQSIGDAANIIRYGRADVMVAGGTESSVVRFGLAGFSAMKALSSRNDEPERASRPFDLHRDGFVMGEGAGILVLESEAHAKARGAEILGEISGHGETSDAYHITSPRPDGAGAIGAMQLALEDAKINPEDVGYFNAHGTSTKYNDASESLALRAVFGENMPPVSSTKSMTGHLLGATGAIEAIACLLAIRDGILPPNINYETPDPECDINIIANVAREAAVQVTMSNSLGFGGHNASLIMRAYE